jgi:hypothetical protein
VADLVSKYQVIPTAYGHAFALTPGAARRLRGMASAELDVVYQRMILAEEPGFCCAWCGMSLDEFCRCVCEYPGEDHVRLAHGTGVVCVGRRDAPRAIRQGRPVKVVFDALARHTGSEQLRTTCLHVGGAVAARIREMGGEVPEMAG